MASTNAIGAYVPKQKPHNGLLIYGLKDTATHNSRQNLASYIKEAGFEDKQAQAMAYYFIFSHENFHALSNLNARANKGADRPTLFNRDLAATIPPRSTSDNNSGNNYEMHREKISDALPYETKQSIPADLLALSIQIEEANSDKCALIQTANIEQLNPAQLTLFSDAIQRWRADARNNALNSIQNNDPNQQNTVVTEMLSKTHFTGDLTSFVSNPAVRTLSPSALLHHARIHSIDNLAIKELAHTPSFGPSPIALKKIQQTDYATSNTAECKEDTLSFMSYIDIANQNTKKFANDFLRSAASLAATDTTGSIAALRPSGKAIFAAPSLTAANFGIKLTKTTLDAFRKLKYAHELQSHEQNMGVDGNTKMIMGCKVTIR